MAFFAPPPVIEAATVARLPETLRLPVRTAWADANKGGEPIASFLEGPVAVEDGALLVTDIPHGRILRVEPGAGAWSEVARPGGWPNGMKLTRAGRLRVTDYRRGLIDVVPATGAVEPVLETLASESFKGLNDLAFAPDGACWFTDQGQTGLQDPSGRVFRLGADGTLTRILANAPSPNGIVVSRDGRFVFVAMTRACEVWRVPADPPRLGAKTQLFARFPGGPSGPDGLAIDAADRLIVCDPGHGCAWVLDPSGVPVLRILSPAGRTVTNCAFGGPDLRTLYMTESETGSILAARMDVPGHPVPRG